jgi:hypothetical protein
MKTSTKKIVLKLALTLTAIFIFTGAIGQGTAVPGQANGVTYATEATTYMVAGTTIPVYALPDPVYHATWNYASGVWTLTPGFTWSWGVTAGASADVVFSQNNVEDNYVTVTISEVGPYTISVTENAPAAFGGCVGEARTLNVEVVATPAATLGALAGQSPSLCATDPLIPTTIPVAISGGWQNYRLAWSLEIATLGPALTKDQWFDTDRTTSLGTVLAYAEDYTPAVPQAVAAAGTHEIMSVGSFTVINNKPTVYTYTLTGINDQALRFGDFITLGGDGSVASAFTYNPITETYTIQVNPAPVTGPIYHIPATWAP